MEVKTHPCRVKASRHNRIAYLSIQSPTGSVVSVDQDDLQPQEDEALFWDIFNAMYQAYATEIDKGCPAEEELLLTVPEMKQFKAWSDRHHKKVAAGVNAPRSEKHRKLMQELRFPC
jgi:hypothetical protein